MTEESSYIIAVSLSTLSFPMLCPSCLAPYPSNSYKTEVSELVGRRGKVETWRTTSLNVPICGSCHTKAFRANKYLKWALILVAVLGMAGIALAYQAVGTGPTGSIDSVVLFMALMVLWLALATAYFVFSPILPVHMISPAELEFRNGQYAELFMTSNRSSVSRTERRRTQPRTIGLAIAGLFSAFAALAEAAGLLLAFGHGLDHAFVGGLYAMGVGSVTIAGVVAVTKGNYWVGRRLIYAGGLWGLPMGLLGVIAIAGGALSLRVSHEELREPPPPPPR